MSADVFVRRTYRCAAGRGGDGEFSTISIYAAPIDPTQFRPAPCPNCGQMAALPFDEQLALTPEIAIEFLERAAVVARKGISE